MRIFFRIVIWILCAHSAFAQELPLNSQIFLNPYYYNPAYAGFEDRPAFYVYRRQQWTGIEGAPVTSGFNFHTIFNEKVNFGVHIMNDERSILNTTRALVTFGYRASFDEFQYLSFGLSGGVGFNTIDLEAIDPDDPAILDALDNNLFLDGNAGFNYYNKGFNLGLSLPKIFKTNTLSSTSFTPGEISPLNDAIFMTSYRWEIAEDKFAIEPHFIYYYRKDLPGQFEAIGLMHLMNVFWLGASYRQDYGTTGFVGLNIKDNFKFGYAYEFFNAQPATFDNGTHDIQLAIIFGEKKKKGKVNLIQKRRDMLRTMGRLPTEQNQNLYQVEKDPFVPPPVDTTTYDEEDALQDLLDEMETEEDTLDIFDIQFDDETQSDRGITPVIIGDVVPEKTAEDQEDELIRQMEEMETEEDTLDIFDIQFDDEAESEEDITPVITEELVPEKVEEDEEDELIRQMEEITFDESEELTDTTESDLDQLVQEFIDEVDPNEFAEPTLNDEGLYIGPTTVLKGDHLLELEQGNYVVVGTFGNYRDAEEYSDQLFMRGFYTKFGYITQTKIYYVYIFENDDLQEAKDTSERFKEIGAQFKENWVLQVQ